MAQQFYAELAANAKKIATPGKGLLAADESTGTIGKRFDGIGIENTAENRKAYRKLLFTAPDELNDYISGVILFEETFKTILPCGLSFAEFLTKRGIVPGIKLDGGLRDLPNTKGEQYTAGLDTLDARAAEFYALGARFAKWRNVIHITKDGAPSALAIDRNAEILAAYAALSQKNGLVPIVEPEVLVLSGDHCIGTAAAVTRRVLAAVYKKLHDHGVYLPGTLLKPNMVLPGVDGPKASAAQIGAATVSTLLETVPPAVPGVTFLSGGQSEEEATVNLDAINSVDLPRPWNLTFSFGRALQHTVLRVWKGEDANVEAAQAALIKRAKANSQAQLGKYEGGAADASSGATLYVANYTY